MRRRLTALLAACSGLAVAACAAEEDVHLVRHRGSLALDWTIDGAQKPEGCVSLGGRTLELVVRDEQSAVVSIEVACDEFALAVELAPGEYRADATIRNEVGVPVSETIALDDIHIASDTRVELAIDFQNEQRD